MKINKWILSKKGSLWSIAREDYALSEGVLEIISLHAPLCVTAGGVHEVKEVKDALNFAHTDILAINEGSQITGAALDLDALYAGLIELNLPSCGALKIEIYPGNRLAGALDEPKDKYAACRKCAGVLSNYIIEEYEKYAFSPFSSTVKPVHMGAIKNKLNFNKISDELLLSDYWFFMSNYEAITNALFRITSHNKHIKESLLQHFTCAFKAFYAKALACMGWLEAQSWKDDEARRERLHRLNVIKASLGNAINAASGEAKNAGENLKSLKNLLIHAPLILRTDGFREFYSLCCSYERLCGFGKIIKDILDGRQYAKMFELWCFFKILELLADSSGKINKINIVDGGLYGVVERGGERGSARFALCYNVPVNPTASPDTYDEWRAISAQIYSKAPDIMRPDYLILKNMGKRWEPAAVMDAVFVNHSLYDELYEDCKRQVRTSYQKNMRNWPLGAGFFIAGDTPELAEEKLRGGRVNFLSIPADVLNGEAFITPEELHEYLL